MQTIRNESNVKPSVEERYGRDGMDYNTNITETEREGEVIYVYDTYRFEDRFDYLNWKYENGIHAKTKG